MWLKLSTGAVVLSMLVVGAHSQYGCNEAVQRSCSGQIASVCSRRICPGSTAGGEAFKEAILNKHNEFRRKAASNGSFGGDMIELQWDDQLATAALAWAHRLCIYNKLSHDSFKCRVTERYNSVGQNAFTGGGLNYADDVAAAYAAVTIWFNEIHQMPTQSMFPYRWVYAGGHYTAVVWSRTYRLGCGLVRRSQRQHENQLWIICNYAPSGNVMNAGTNVFQPSSSLGSLCMPGTSKGPSGLCVVDDEKTYRRHIRLNTVPAS